MAKKHKGKQKGKVRASLIKVSSQNAFATPATGWQSEFDRLWKKLVPPRNEASTKDGELLRCIGKLADEAYRNGKMNFNERHMRMCAFIAATLDDASVFSKQERAEIKRAIGLISDAETPDTSGMHGPHHFLAALSVRWCKAQKQ